MKLPKLFKKTTTGATQSWEIEVINNKFRTISGQLAGKKITNNWTVCTGKNTGKANATTDAEQALKEAEAKHKKKREKGYTLDINKIDKKKFYEPMLAQDFKNKNRQKEVMFEIDEEGIGAPVFSQPKLDGIRCIAMREGLFTRTGKEITAVPHIHEALEPFFKKYPNAVLDGELYNHAYKDDFNKIIHLVRKQNLTNEHLEESEEMIQYWIYDAPVIGEGFGGRYNWTEKDSFSDRTSILDAQFPNLGLDKEDCLVLVETTEIHGREQLDRCYEDYVEAGYEGQMIRLDGPYENKRSPRLLKRKEFIDEEYTILGVSEGKGNRTGTVGHLEFQTKDGKDFKSSVKGTFEYVQSLWENKNDLINKDATIKYFNLTPDGIPRFPYVIAIRDYE